MNLMLMFGTRNIKRFSGQSWKKNTEKTKKYFVPDLDRFVPTRIWKRFSVFTTWFPGGDVLSFQYRSLFKRGQYCVN